MSQDKISKIHVISTSTIKIPPQPESTARINLTPWDLELLFLEYSQKGLLFLKPSPHQQTQILTKTSTTSLIHHLKASFEQTLQFFPPLAGRLATTRSDDGTATCFFVDCNHIEGGALFIHATVEDENITVADVINSSTNIVRSFFPLTGVRNYDGVSQPLMAVQVTELVDGLFIGFSINHLLVDGTSFWHLFNSWAEISRGEIPIGSPISKIPFLNRDLITLDLIGSNTIYISHEHLNFDKNPLPQLPSQQQLRDRVFHFTKENIAKLKARANQEMAAESKGKVISSLQAIMAHIWRSIIRCRSPTNSGAHETTTFEISIGARQRLKPPLPEEYFGNAVFPGFITLEIGKLLENNLGWTAWQINRVVASSDGPDKVREFYMDWIKKPTFLQSNGFPSNYFVLINSPRFNVYGNDFGWGKPVAARTGGANSHDGRITVSSWLKEGSVEIEACLFAETLSALEEDDEFMEFVSS
ncbi:hypothetical protein DH2020_001546 [Rehmannia glutinosa]|uniref:HXXXD-type acyl-transferase family protein n=1 Tax=Rehmannia glutinosa TaxID=99300 RepID=A0ABR0XZN8_REHGL